MEHVNLLIGGGAADHLHQPAGGPRRAAAEDGQRPSSGQSELPAAAGAGQSLPRGQPVQERLALLPGYCRFGLKEQTNIFASL